MNARTTIIALVITCSLAAVTLLVFQGGGGRVPGTSNATGGTGTSASQSLPGWYQQLSITQAQQLDVKHADGLQTILARDPHTKSLMIEGWPVLESTADAALRLLSQAVPTSQKAPQPGASAHVQITLNGQHIMRLHPQSLGGGAQAALDGVDMALNCDPRLISLFEPEAMLAWRASSAFPFLSQSSSGGPSLEQVKSIAMDAPGKVVQLDRRGRSWRVGKLGPAQAETCEGLLQMLGAIKVSRFIGPPDSVAQNWIASPRLMVTVDSDIRQLDALVKPDASVKPDAPSTQLRVRTLRQELRLGGSADGSGNQLLAQSVAYWVDDAQVQTPAYGPMVVVIESQSVGGLNLDRLGYVSQSPLSAAIIPSADITSLYLGDELIQEQLIQSEAPTLANPQALDQPGGALNRVILKRTIDGWRAVESTSLPGKSGGNDFPGKPINEDSIKSLLAVLTGTGLQEKSAQSTTQVFDTAPPGIKPLGTLVVATARGPQEVLYIASRDERNNARQLCIRVAGLYYLFTEEVSEPVLSFIREIMPTQG